MEHCRRKRVLCQPDIVECAVAFWHGQGPGSLKRAAVDRTGLCFKVKPHLHFAYILSSCARTHLGLGTCKREGEGHTGAEILRRESGGFFPPLTPSTGGKGIPISPVEKQTKTGSPSHGLPVYLVNLPSFFLCAGRARPISWPGSRRRSPFSALPLPGYCRCRRPFAASTGPAAGCPVETTRPGVPQPQPEHGLLVAVLCRPGVELGGLLPVHRHPDALGVAAGQVGHRGGEAQRAWAGRIPA